MRLIACLIEVTAHYRAVYCKLYEHQDAESYCFGRSASSRAHVGITGALWGGREGQRLRSSGSAPASLPKGSIFFQGCLSQPSTANAFQCS